MAIPERDRANPRGGQACPLCGSLETSPVDGDLRCGVCDLGFVPKTRWVDRSEEQTRYLLHENDPADPHYRKYLETLWNPLTEHLSPNSLGLDYGCGPSKGLETIASEHQVQSFDPIFYPEPIDGQFDFVFCCEVVEHFKNPRTEFEKLAGLLKPNGLLAIRTDPVDWDKYESWYYRKDPTHLSFYSPQTLSFLSHQSPWSPVLREGRISLLRKSL